MKPPSPRERTFPLRVLWIAMLPTEFLLLSPFLSTGGEKNRSNHVHNVLVYSSLGDTCGIYPPYCRKLRSDFHRISTPEIDCLFLFSDASTLRMKAKRIDVFHISTHSQVFLVQKFECIFVW